MTPDDLIQDIATAPASAGLVLDFDGVLAPIVDDPATSAMTEGLDEVIEVLGRRLAVVAIVSGRPANFLGDRAAIPGVRLLGLYGTEEWRDGGPVARPEAAAWQPALDDARDRFALALAGHPGVVMEDKGLAVALHWRNAEDRKAAADFVGSLVADVAADTGLAREPGKFVEELRPPVEWDKGSSVKALAAEFDLRTVIYAGDDRGDLPAFAAARELGGHALVVEHGGETPDDVRAVADVILDGVDAMREWLTDVAAAL